MTWGDGSRHSADLAAEMWPAGDKPPRAANRGFSCPTFSMRHAWLEVKRTGSYGVGGGAVTSLA